MQQLLQNINNGQLEVRQIPAPMVRDGELLIANRASVISAGTDRMTMELSKKSLLGKARSRPDHVRRVVEKLRNEGFWQTLHQVREKLDSPMAMGYSSAGIVLACGRGVRNFQVGDHVASNGPHAEIVSVPKNLCARIPEGVPFEQGALGVLGAIALQGVRLAHISLGETVFVIGLGLVGQLAVGLLSAAGCRVVGTDPDPSKCELARKMGADLAEPNLSAAKLDGLTGGLGTDAVLITASTKSNQPIDLAAAAVRRKGRVVLVGVVGLQIDRRPFYFKEAEFVVSCSYGPGRYDADYEERGHDYPAAWVRWTEQRNIQAVLDLMGRGRLDVAPLISHRFPVARALEAYDLVEANRESYIGILLEYPQTRQNGKQSIVLGPSRPQAGLIGAGVLGAGNHARMDLLPAIRRCKKLAPRIICSAGGVSAAHSGRKLRFERATTNEDEVFADDAVDAIFSITRHNEHCRHVLKAIEAKMPIFVEKPLCLSIEEFELIEEALQEAGHPSPLLMVGFNRRFAPSATALKAFFNEVSEPLTISIRFNAGVLEKDHWAQQEEIGGGRIVGEACHGIDLATYLADSPPVQVYCESVGGPMAPQVVDDQCFITLRHANGSISSIAYLAGGDRSFPKERVEVLGGGQVGVIDDLKQITLCRGGKTRTKKFAGKDKGFDAEIEAFAKALCGESAPPIPWFELRTVTLASILAVQSLREGIPLEIPEVPSAHHELRLA